jgi:hypothetical protein
VTASEKHRHHHSPTDASISAVASFAADPAVNVRAAVARALAANSESARLAASTLRQLLRDESPLVRVAVAHAIARPTIVVVFAPKELQSSLYDDVWTVRWAIAGALSGTSLHIEAWRALATSIPRKLPPLAIWAIYAERFTEDLCRDHSVRNSLRDRLSASADDKYFVDAVKELLARCDSHGA